MRTLLEKQGYTVQTCRLNCGQANSIDDLGHYCICPVFWNFLGRSIPSGMGFSLSLKSKFSFLLVADAQGEQDKVRMALALYGLFRCVNHLRHEPHAQACDVYAAIAAIRKAWC